MKLTKDIFFQVIDWLMVLSMTVAAYGMVNWNGGPFWGASIYLIARHIYAAATGDYIHDRTGYRLLDLFFIASLVVAGFAFPVWSGGPFIGAFVLVAMRFILEALMPSSEAE